MSPTLPPGLPIVPDDEHPPTPLPPEPRDGNGQDRNGPGSAAAAPFDMSADEFEEAVRDALLYIPRRVSRAMDNVAIFIEDNYTPGPGEKPDTVLLGLYEGVPLTERDSGWDAGSLPDRITIFRQPILDICASREEVIDEIAVTVVHEIAHHFGIGDQRLHELGWG